ncbi:MAG: hypothetical protein AB7F89_13405 [Pirellulaceae bacterium]
MHIYQPDGKPEILAARDSILGSGPLLGLVLDVRRTWQPKDNTVSAF